MVQLTARPPAMQAASTGENLLGQLSEAAKMTIRSTPFAHDLYIHG
jgi:hypothetical protein